MSADKPWTSEQAEHALNQLAESIEAAQPSEIEDDIASLGEDLSAIASDMKGAALAGIKKFQQRRLHQARQRSQENSRRIERRTRKVASSPKARRKQFLSLLRASPDFQAKLTVQHRDFNALTDADIESALEDLDALGAMDDLGETEDDPKS
jgi:hypothetical protein